MEEEETLELVYGQGRMKINFLRFAGADAPASVLDQNQNEKFEKLDEYLRGTSDAAARKAEARVPGMPWRGLIAAAIPIPTHCDVLRCDAM